MTRPEPEYAGFGARVAAGAIDLTLLVFAAAVLTWLGLEIGAPSLDDREALFQAAGDLWSRTLLVTVAALSLAVMSACWTLIQATPGQLLMGCRVCGGRGGALNPLLALWRGVVLLAAAGPAALPLATMFVDRRRRGAHDWLSGSVVVLEDESRVSLDEWSRRLR